MKYFKPFVIFYLTFLLILASIGSAYSLRIGTIDTNSSGAYFGEVVDEDRQYLHLNHSWSTEGSVSVKNSNTAMNHRNIATCTCATRSGVEITVQSSTPNAANIEVLQTICPARPKNPPHVA